ncbi:hypothetical protein B0H14DRAFT_3875594 [Mycena olivaceomarginata]|nr:hypothetical protein B0H14DRAFT_3875594 [Mycena olivaceomarginata]
MLPSHHRAPPAFPFLLSLSHSSLLPSRSRTPPGIVKWSMRRIKSIMLPAPRAKSANPANTGAGATEGKGPMLATVAVHDTAMLSVWNLTEYFLLFNPSF